MMDRLNEREGCAGMEGARVDGMQTTAEQAAMTGAQTGGRLSRRRFIEGQVLASLGVAGAPILARAAGKDSPRSATGEEPAAAAGGKTGKDVQEGILSGCHWGAFYGIVKDGRAVEFKPWSGDPAPSPQLPGVLDSLYSPSRIRYPMVRRAWLEKGPGADPDGRGSGDFVRVSWDKAIELVADELVRVRKKYGQQAVFAGSYGWKSPGRVHNCRTLLRRMLNLTGSYTNSSGDYSTGAAQVILPYVSGSLEVYEQCTAWDNLAKHCQLMVFWGCNPLNNSQISWQVADHGAWPGVAAMKKAGTKVISIDPVLTETCKELNGEWIAPRPQTDVPMMLGIAIRCTRRSCTIRHSLIGTPPASTGSCRTCWARPMARPRRRNGRQEYAACRRRRCAIWRAALRPTARCWRWAIRRSVSIMASRYTGC